MVQRKAPIKIGIKSHHHKSDTRLINLKTSSSSSSQTHEKMKIMKKSRSIKRSDESPPFKKKKPQQLHTDELPGLTPATPQKQSPNYMKSTSSFEARKEQSPKNLTPKGSRNYSETNDQSASRVKGSRTSSLKTMRTLTKTTSFKPLRSSKKVILCEDVESQRATCSSTLKESKFPNYLQLDHGGTELDGTSAIKVCPYAYCSLNGHHHAPVPPLKCFLSAKRRALKSQKNSKLARRNNPNSKKSNPVISAPEEENREFFVNDHDLEYSDMDWVEGYCSDSGLKLQEIDEDKIGKTIVERLYDEESVSSGALFEEDGELSESEICCEKTKINQDYEKYEVSSIKAESDMHDEHEGLIEDENVNYQKEETFNVPEFAEKVKDETDKKNHTTIIYNIIQYNISVFVNREKTEDKTVTVKEPATCVAGDKMESEVADEEVISTVQDHNPEQECNQSNSMDEEEPAIAIISDVDETNDITKTSNSLHTKSELCKNTSEEIGDDSPEFNPRGPNFLPETPDPDAETVDLKHQMIDERKNAEEWMVDFALQQAVTTLAPARKRKVALLVEAFEKVMPDPVPRNRHGLKAFTNSRPMQACS